jgi:hypothetical protein
MGERVSVRLSPLLLERLDDLAAARGMTRSACLRALVAEGVLPAAEEIPDEAELLRVLSERARSGNVSGARRRPPSTAGRAPLTDMGRTEVPGRRVTFDATAVNPYAALASVSASQGTTSPANILLSSTRTRNPPDVHPATRRSCSSAAAAAVP